MNKDIVYGGTFNPPTIAHLNVIKYLITKFPDNNIIILPSNAFYKNSKVASFLDRVKMLELLLLNIDISNRKRVTISTIENELEKMGTYYTLKHLSYPYFVLGADSFLTIKKWRCYENLVKENKFLIIPRNGININSYIMNDALLSEYHYNFIILDDFHCIDVSSSLFRSNELKELLNDNVYQYIIDNHIY